MSATTQQQSPGSSSARTGPDVVVDLKTARQARQTGTAGWSCETCDLSSTGFGTAEAAYLARVHDQLRHGARQTALIQVTGPATDPVEAAG